MNLYMIYKENIMIIDDIDAIAQEKKTMGDDYDVILQNMGQEVLLLRPMQSTKALIYLNSGLQYEVPMSILVDEEENVLSKKLKPHPIFIYQMICTSDMEN